jgi:hypothetical protein
MLFSASASSSPIRLPAGAFAAPQAKPDARLLEGASALCQVNPYPSVRPDSSGANAVFAGAFVGEAAALACELPGFEAKGPFVVSETCEGVHEFQSLLLALNAEDAF